MGLNRMMMKNGEVKVVDGYKSWDWSELDNKTISFTVPPGIKRIEVTSVVDNLEGNPDEDIYASIKNTSTNKVWGDGWFATRSDGSVIDFKDIDSIVGVTPNKTYRLLFNCLYTRGVTFSWGQAINDMTPTVEDY
jgi:hypothetical protein